MRQWKALQGPPKEVFFPQDHLPGIEGAFDFTHGNELGITIAGASYPHLIFEYVLSSSKFTTTSIAYSETFEALSSCLQAAFGAIGGVPAKTRSDNLSAATHQLKKARGRALTPRYEALLEHYGTASSLIQPGKPNENGIVEQRHRWSKKALAQALVFRGSSDFTSEGEYAVFVQDVINRSHSAKVQAAFKEEQAYLRSLPTKKLASYAESRVKVTRWSTIRVVNRTYSVPSRLIGHQVRVRIHADHLDVYYSDGFIETLPRIRQEDGHRVDYRHIIHSLVRKPGAFAKYRFREDLFPSLSFRRGYDAMVKYFGDRSDVEYVRILHLSATTLECDVDKALEQLLAKNESFGFSEVQSIVAPKTVTVPVIRIGVPCLADYDDLLTGAA